MRKVPWAILEYSIFLQFKIISKSLKYLVYFNKNKINYTFLITFIWGMV